jgi:hypothetical protein
MKRLICVMGLLGVACTLIVTVLAVPGHASFVSQFCEDYNHPDDHVRRADARAYAEIADNEGYEWGGGCWNDNNRDDTPNQPDSNGEGPDCSGFVFKTWELKLTVGASGWQWWSGKQDIHGHYGSATFHDAPAGDPFFNIAKDRSKTLYMDAFARDGHVGMLYTQSPPPGGGDYIIEARNDASGTDVNPEPYRGDPDYKGVRRENWTADCYPNCVARPGQDVVYVT